MEEKGDKYLILVEVKKNEYGKSTAEKRNALKALDGLEIKEGEKEEEEDKEVGEHIDDVEVDDNVNTSL